MEAAEIPCTLRKLPWNQNVNSVDVAFNFSWKLFESFHENISWKLFESFHENISWKLSWKPLSFRPSGEAAAYFYGIKT